MNKKLCKLEIKETKKLMLLNTVLITVYLTISSICSAAEVYATKNEPLTVKIILVLISALLILFTALIMVKRYYNILFTDEGYIRFSFPVKNRSHLQANLKCAALWLSLQIIIFFTGLGISDHFTKDRGERWGVGELFHDLSELYRNNIRGHFLNSSDIKASIVVFLMLIASIVIAVNIYLSFIFVLSISAFICGKFGIMQKKGVIILGIIIMYNLHMLAAELFNKLTRLSNSEFVFSSGYDLFGSDIVFVADMAVPIFYIFFYGLTSFAMYMICKNILDKNLNI